MAQKFSLKFFLAALIAAAISVSSASASQFNFREVAEDRFNLLVNGRFAKRLDFRKKAINSFSINKSVLRRLGVRGDLDRELNRDLGNSAYANYSSKAIFSLSESTVRGQIRDKNPLPRSHFDFRRVGRNSYRLFIMPNPSIDVPNKNSLYVTFKDDKPTTIVISKKSLSERFGLTGRTTEIVDRTFGNNWRKTGDRYEIDVSKRRAQGTGDTLFFFKQVETRENQFITYINGIKANYLNLDKVFKVNGNPAFTLSKETLAERFGLSGDLKEMFPNAEESGLKVIMEGSRYVFSVERSFFRAGGERVVNDTTYLVRRTVASPS